MSRRRPLDVTIQAQILDLLAELKASVGMSMLFITHDLTIVRRIADRVCVMQEGEIVEQGPTAEIFANPTHDYTRMLLNAGATGHPDPVPEGAEEVASAEDLRIWFPIERGLLRRVVGHIKAVNAASFSVRAGETVGIVGESGSGKTTLALAMMRLISSQGPVVFMGADIQGWKNRDLRPLRRDMQIVFQDPYGSLSPRMTAEEIISEGLSVHEVDPDRPNREMVAEIMQEVGLDPWNHAPLSARVFRWPAPAHRHSPRHDPAPQIVGAGRANFGPRYDRAGADRRTSARSAEKTQAGLSVYQPRPGKSCGPWRTRSS